MSNCVIDEIDSCTEGLPSLVLRTLGAVSSKPLVRTMTSVHVQNNPRDLSRLVMTMPENTLNRLDSKIFTKSSSLDRNKKEEQIYAHQGGESESQISLLEFECSFQEGRCKDYSRNYTSESLAHIPSLSEIPSTFSNQVIYESKAPVFSQDSSDGQLAILEVCK